MEVGEGGRDDCYTYSNIGMFNSNPIGLYRDVWIAAIA